MSEAQIVCPVCNATDSTKLYPDYRGRCVSSQMSYYEDIELDNRCCKTCGLIFNAKGFRNKEDEFFSCVDEQRKPQLLSFAKGVKTTHHRAMEIFERLTDIKESGTMLDFGAGPGSFLSIFQERYPKWELSGIEPREDFPNLIKNVRLKNAYNQPYYDVELDQQYDMVAVMNVLEHLPDPMHAMRWIHASLKPGGKVLMRNPNFMALPGDLFCPDHLNKMTMVHAGQMAEYTGFEILGSDDSTSIFYFILKKHEQPLRGLPDCYEENLANARKAENIARSTVQAVGEAVSSALDKNKKAAVFGIAPIGSMAHLILDCKESIACFVDENQKVWGRNIDGLPVVGPDRMAEFGVSDLALAISPLYWETVADKMADFDVQVHIPRL